LPHGVLFRGNADDDSEGKIRKNLIEKNNIDAIIGLPANIFFGTGIPTLIMVLKQHRDNDDVLIIDASKGFVKEGKQNKLRACDVKKIADAIRVRADIPGFSRKVTRDEIRENGYNLNIPRYVDSSDKAEQFDLYATMFGGIPQSEIDELQAYWTAFPSLREDLFAKQDGKPFYALKEDDIKSVIENNAEVKLFMQSFANAFNGFDQSLNERLVKNVMHVQEMKAQDAIAEDIFARMAHIPLVNKYAAFQVLAENWNTISNDVEMIQSEGIDTVRVVEPAYKVVKKNDEMVEVQDGIKGRILPFDLVQSVKFTDELNAIAEKETRVAEIDSLLDEVRDSFTEDEQSAYLDDDDNTKLDKKAITADAKKKSDEIEAETKAKLKSIIAYWDEQKKLNKTIKEERFALIQLTKEAIENLSAEEIEQFLYLKWIAPICNGVNATATNTLSIFESQVKHIAEKYATSFNQLNEDLSSAENELASLIGNLTGDEYSIIGLQEFAKTLKS
jgi:type I restriction enzyme M protein